MVTAEHLAPCKFWGMGLISGVNDMNMALPWPSTWQNQRTSVIKEIFTSVFQSKAHSVTFGSPIYSIVPVDYHDDTNSLPQKKACT